jgi:hypothetical protein
MTDIDSALLARIEAAQTTKDLFLIGAEIMNLVGSHPTHKHNVAFAQNIVNAIIARRNMLIGYDPKLPRV